MTEASEAAILKHLSTSADAAIEDTFPWSEASKLDHAAVVGAIKSLLADKFVEVNDLSTSFYTLTAEGQSILENGAQEVIVLKALNEAGKLSLTDLQTKVGKNIAKIGMGNCMKKKWLKKDGADLVPLKKNDEVEDEVQKTLQALSNANFSSDGIAEKVSFDSFMYVVKLFSPLFILCSSGFQIIVGRKRSQETKDA
jgi:phenylalanyl-tRNA synthetase alpha chain